jgi:Kef-type K+ transport system membrane component KefB
MIAGMPRGRIMNTMATVVILAGLATVVILSPVSSMGVSGEEATFCLGFILLFAYYLAKILKEARLPVISSYIFAGMICGPYVINILSRGVVTELQLFDDMALAIIALIAGGEMKLRILRAKKRAFLSVIAAQIAFSFAGALLVIFFARDSIQFLAGRGGETVVAVALIFGLVTAARSPSTTIGVITETRSKGPLTELLIGVTVILDIIILVLVAFILPLAEALSNPAVSFSMSFARGLMIEIFGSIGIGVVFGIIVGSYIKWVREYLPLFLVGLGFAGSVFCRHYHLEPILAFMIAGCVIENFTYLGEELIRALERSSFPVYVIFFAISGASINLDALRAMWPLALVLVIMRAGAFYAGSFAAARIAADVKPYARSMWLGFLSQAGVTLGIASLVERRFSWGGDIKTIILAVVAVNQMLGPIALKVVLERKGETGKMDAAVKPPAR